MALYDYDLILIKRFSGQSIINELFKADLIHYLDDTNGIVLEEINISYRENVNRSDPICQYNIVTLALNTGQFEKILKSNAKFFLHWFWKLVKVTNIDYAFITPESYAEYYSAGNITSEVVYNDVYNVLNYGKIKVIHPFMFFADELYNGNMCTVAQNAPYFTVYRKKDIGCLLMFIDGTLESNHIEILDPGEMYADLLRHFTRSN